MIDQKKLDHVMGVAHDLFDQRPNWGDFFAATLGSDGVVSQAFSGPEIIEFRASDAYADLMDMCKMLRDKGAESTERQQVITVRMPKSLHQSLKTEAHGRRKSLNSHCIDKLMAPLAEVTDAVR